MTGPDPERVEKNWIPVEYKTTLCAIYKLHPLVLVDTNYANEFVTIPVPSRSYNPQADQLLQTLRGSSTLVPFAKGWLGMFHTRIYEGEL